MTLKPGVMMLKIQIYHHRNKLHFKMYSNRKQLFYIVIIFHNITIFFYCIFGSLVYFKKEKVK